MNRIVILMYHIVAEPARRRRRDTVAPRGASRRRCVISVSRVVRLLTLDADRGCTRRDAPAGPDGGVAVTFDDGFADTFANALPVLARYRIPATMFAVSDLIGTSNEWMSARGFPKRRLMSALRAAGDEHGRSYDRQPHAYASTPARARCRSEARRDSRQQGAPRGHDRAQRDDLCLSIRTVRRRCPRTPSRRPAIASPAPPRSGFNGPDVDRYLLRRIEVFGSDNLWQFRQKLKFGANDVSNFYPLRYYAGRILARLGL